MLDTIIICITAVICCLITVGGINRSVWWISQTMIRLKEGREASAEEKRKILEMTLKQ